MATLADWTTITDIQKTLDPNGTPARMINLLKQTNPMLDDMIWMPTNDATTHRTSVVTSLPTASERVYNEGALNDKETASQFVEGTNNIEVWSEVDADMVDLETDPAAYRFQKAQSFLEGLNQKFMANTLYGNNGTNMKQINGFLTRYNDITGPENAQNIIDAGGTGTDNTSMLLVGWGMNATMGLYPKNTTAGLKHVDKGRVTKDHVGAVTDAKMEVYRDQWKWHWGIAIQDWRYVVRVANIDVSILRANSSPPDLIDLMIQAEACIPYPETVKLVWYIPRMVFTHLTRQRRTEVKAGGGITYENVDGVWKANFNMIPVHRLDAFSIAEARVI